MTEDRKSHAFDAELVTDPDEIARLEARNALLQFDTVIQMIEEWCAPERRGQFKLRPSTILSLHRVALQGLSAYAGNWRPAGVEIGGSKLQPVPAFLVPEKAEEMCDYVNREWSRNAIHLAAYTLWRLNWIHPFTDGNGRTARAVSYLVLCVRLGYRLPGTKTIPELIAADKRPYYSALEIADSGNLAELENFMQALLARQLVDVHSAAQTNGTDQSPPEPRLH
jgi:Fic family protein